MWKRGAQEVRVPRKKRKKGKESCTTARSMGEGEGTQWS